MRNLKKILSFLLVLSMVMSYVPMPVLAAEGDACTVTTECTGVYVDGACNVCGESEPTHTHVYDGDPAYVEKDETVHTVTRACTTCEEKPTETVDEAHTYVDGACACGKTEPPADDVGDGFPVPPAPVDEAVEAVKAQLEALPTLEALSTMTNDEKIALHDTAYLTAGNAYNALTEEQKAQVDATKLMALGAYFADPNNLMTTDEPVTYNITIANDITNGTVTADKTTAAAGETVTLTVTPDTGYVMKSLPVSAGTDSIDATLGTDGKYTFTMPASNVEIKAVFEEETPVTQTEAKWGTSADSLTESGTLAEAIAAAVSGQAQYIQLQKNVQLTDELVVSNGQTTIDLNNKTIERDVYYAFAFSGGTHSITNGTIKGSIHAYGNSKVTLYADIDAANQYAVMVDGGGTLTVAGGTVESTTHNNGVALAAAVNGTLKITGGTVTGKHIGLQGNGNATITVDGGQISGDNAGIYTEGNSNITVRNGAVSATGAGGKTLWMNGGTLNVTGGTFRGATSVRLVSGSVTLSGGTFSRGILVENTTLNTILAEDYNYYQKNQVCKINANDTAITGEEDVTVAPAPVIPVTSVSLSKSHLDLVVPKTQKLTATVTPDNATNKNVIWSSSDTSIATVDESGTVTAVAPGAAIITVKAQDDNNISDSCTVKVVAEYPVWVAGDQVTSDNMNDVLGDGTVSYDPVEIKLMLKGKVSCPDPSTSAIATTYGAGITLTIEGSGTISASSGSGIYATNANVKLTGGPFTVNGTSYGIYLGTGNLIVDGAQVRATTNDTTKYGVLTYAGAETMENGGGLLAVTGSKATVQGSYTMGSETFDELGVAANATLTISSGATVTVNDYITSSGTIQINGTLKVPAGSGKTTMRGGTLYIGEKGYQWHETDKKYYCLTHDWVYTATDKDAAPGAESISIHCGSCDFDSGFLSIEADDAIYDGESHGASLNIKDLKQGGAEAPSWDDIRYQFRLSENESYRDVESPVNAGFYKASITMDNATASVEYTISPKPLTDTDITVTLDKTVITDPKEIPRVTVMHGNKTLEGGKDYVVVTTGAPASGFGECEIQIHSVRSLSEDGLGGNYDGFVTNTYLLLANPDKVEPDNKDAIDAYDRYSDEQYKNIYGDELTKALEELHEALTDYDIIKGHKRNYVKGSYKKFSFIANGYFGKFTGVEVDGKLIDEKYYTAESGSTIITLKTSYLESLKTGKHTIQVNYTDGNTGGEEYFRITVNNGSPLTGDNSNILFFGGMTVFTLFCMAMVIVFFPRKKGKYQR